MISKPFSFKLIWDSRPPLRFWILSNKPRATEGLIRANELSATLRQELRARLVTPPALALNHKPSVILVVGVNGSGKTTTIAKLAPALQ